MSRPLFLLRPEPGWSASADAARARGIEVAGHPLSSVEAVSWALPRDRSFDGLLVGSANAFRHGGDQLAEVSHLPVYVVGEATAEAAHEAGFTVAGTGSGGLQALLDTLEGRSLALLRLAGEERVDLEPPTGITLTEVTVYRSRALPLEENVVERLREGGLVALHSGGTARHFRQEFERAGLSPSQVEILTLGPRIAGAAGPDWKAIHIAGAPNDAALLALAESLCNNGPEGRI